MSVTADTREQIARAVIRRRMTVNMLYYVAFFFLFVGVISLRYANTSITGLAPSIELGLGLGIGIALIVIAYLSWRCPSCGKTLGFNFSAKSCPRCKANFKPFWKPKDERRLLKTVSRKKKTRSSSYIFLIGVCLIVIFLSNQAVGMVTMYVILAGVILAFGILDLLYWRCPNCKSHLGRGWNPIACPKCDTKLQ